MNTKEINKIMSKIVPVKDMNKEILKYPIYIVNTSGKLIRVHNIKSTDDYNHGLYELHHFIKYSYYERNKDWFRTLGIEQKLILMSKELHEQLHNQAIKTLSDKDFEKKYKIKKKLLIYSNDIT